jgi:hypothetical protein
MGVSDEKIRTGEQVRFVEFYIRQRWPDAQSRVDIQYDVGNLLYHTSIGIMTPSGQYVFVTQTNNEYWIDPKRYRISDDSIASIILLLGT